MSIILGVDEALRKKLSKEKNCDNCGAIFLFFRNDVRQRENHVFVKCPDCTCENRLMSKPFSY